MFFPRSQSLVGVDKLRPRRLTRKHLSVRAETSPTSDNSNIASPFTNASVHRAVGEVPASIKEMTRQNVEDALDAVRPYLLADGGDVEVVEISAGKIFLRLAGNCSSCAASDATLRMGIERALRSTFGPQLVEVVQVREEAAGPQATTLELVRMHLGMLSGAVRAYGGTIDVVEVQPPVVRIAYTGPEGIGQGIKAAVIAQFKDIRTVDFV